MCCNFMTVFITVSCLWVFFTDKGRDQIAAEILDTERLHGVQRYEHRQPGLELRPQTGRSRITQS